MTDNRNRQDEGDLGHHELDPRERADAEVNLDDPSAGDDEPWSPPDRKPRGSEFVGVETAEGETLDQRINQELPEEGTAYGAPDEHGDREAERMVGGDDPDAIPADQDVLGGPVEEDAVTGESPEQSAMHVEEDR
ncbi:hypothetical protein [Nocardioides coralli]|uniref:hypothetical protein n=1 Tax=Nocardioides coralli TaxID=2872154 RepID=UPI001CA40080|nr:hypothetical protein [Nocardioides coralli]QZY29095.1 hypothetical protein K6T13_16970 [Nocardioides coralli]